MGGAIIKNKLFYFLSADITRRNFPIVDSQVKVGFVDTANQVWVGCGAPATPAQCNAINALLPRFYGQIPRTADNDLYFGRLDYHFNDKNTFSASFNFLRWLSPNGIQTGLSSTTGAGNQRQRRRYAWRCATARPPGPSFPTAAGQRIPLRPGYGPPGGWIRSRLNIGGGAWLLSSSGGRRAAWDRPTYLPRVEPMETRNEFADDLSWAKGKHTDQIRRTFEHVQDDVNYLSNRFGSYTYSTVTAFALDYTGNTTGAKN